MARRNLGIACLNLRQDGDALKLLQTAARLQPSDPDTRFHLGRAYQQLGQYRQAAEAFEAALQFQPNLIDARFELGRCLQLGDRQAALKVYEELKCCDKKRVAPLYALSSKRASGAAPRIPAYSAFVSELSHVGCDRLPLRRSVGFESL